MISKINSLKFLLIKTQKNRVFSRNAVYNGIPQNMEDSQYYDYTGVRGQPQVPKYDNDSSVFYVSLLGDEEDNRKSKHKKHSKIKKSDETKVQSTESTNVTSEQSKSSSLMFSKWQIIGAVIFLIFIIFIILLFLVIIPSVLQDNVDNTDITVESSALSAPNDKSFHSLVNMRFSEQPGVLTKIKLKNTRVYFDDKHIVTLKNNKRVTVDDNNVKAITSYASVYNNEDLSDFCSYAIQHSDYQWKLKGNAEVSFFLGTYIVEIDKDIYMEGFNNFSIDPNILEVITYAGSENFLQTKIIVNITNEGNMKMDFQQDLHYHVLSRGVEIGIGTIYNANFSLDSFLRSSQVNLQYSNHDQYTELMHVLSLYTMGIDQPLTLTNLYLEEEVSWLTKSLHDIELSTVLPGLEDRLLNQIDMYINRQTTTSVPFTMNLTNNFDTNMTVTTIIAHIYYQNTSISFVNEYNLTIYIPPRTMIVTDRLTATTDAANTDTLLELLDAGSGLLDITSNITALVGYYNTTIQYDVNQVPAYFHEET